MTQLPTAIYNRVVCAFFMGLPERGAYAVAYAEIPKKVTKNGISAEIPAEFVISKKSQTDLPQRGTPPVVAGVGARCTRRGAAQRGARGRRDLARKPAGPASRLAPPSGRALASDALHLAPPPAAPGPEAPCPPHDDAGCRKCKIPRNRLHRGAALP